MTDLKSLWGTFLTRVNTLGNGCFIDADYDGMLLGLVRGQTIGGMRRRDRQSGHMSTSLFLLRAGWENDDEKEEEERRPSVSNVSC